MGLNESDPLRFQLSTRERRADQLFLRETIWRC